MNKNNNFTEEEKEWYKQEQLKDEIAVQKYKQEIIVIKKLSLWKKLKKMLGF